MHRVRFTTAAPLLAVALAACGTSTATPAAGPTPTAAPAPTEGAITPSDLRHRLEIIAHDSMGGRGTGSEGLRKTESYIASELKRLGLRPAGDDGGWFNRVELERTRSVVSASLDGAALGTSELVPVSGIAGLPGGPRGEGGGPVFYGGYVVDPETAPLTAAQVEGKTVVLRLGAAPGAQGGAPRLVIPALIGPGSKAAAVVLVAEGELQDFWEHAVGVARSGDIARAGGRPSAAGGPAVFLASPAGAERLVGRSLEGLRQPGAGAGSFRYTLREEREPVEAFNVVAVLPGTDPARAGEYVAVGAHHDHVGIGAPVDGDSIYNGADDDGSGTVAVIEIAERFASLPQGERPARSLLFVWHTAEEKGLLGSEQFTENPTVPRESIVAQLNIDMIGRNHPDSLMLVGSRRLSTQLGDLVEAVNTRQARPFTFDYSWDEPGHPERIYCRSDHYNYARYGIPVTFFTTGLHPEYHKPQDQVELIEYDKLARVTRLIGDIAGEIADRPERPAVDKPVPPLGTPCT